MIANKSKIKSKGRVKPHQRLSKKGNLTNVKAYQRAYLTPVFRQYAEKIVTENMGLLINIGKQYANIYRLEVNFEHGQPINDLADVVGAARKGFLFGMLAWRKRNPRKPFNTNIEEIKKESFQDARVYARNIARKLSRITYDISPEIIRDITYMKNVEAALMEQTGGTYPNIELLAANMNMYKVESKGKRGTKRKKKQVERTFEEKKAHIKMLQFVYEDQFSSETITPAVWSEHDRPDTATYMKSKINAIISDLTDRRMWTRMHEQVIRLRYGIGSNVESGGLNWHKVTNRINATRSKNKVKVEFVQKLHGESLEVLRPYFEIESFDKSFSLVPGKSETHNLLFV